MLSLFSCAIGHLHLFFEEMSVDILGPGKKLGHLSFCCCHWMIERIKWENVGNVYDPGRTHGKQVLNAGHYFLQAIK